MGRQITNDAELREAIAFIDGAIAGGGLTKAALAERAGLKDEAITEFLSGAWDGTTAARYTIGERIIAAVCTAGRERCGPGDPLPG